MLYNGFMKAEFVRFQACSIVILLLISLFSCGSRSTVEAGDEDALIDSLIQLNRIDENTLVIAFGADAISAIKTKEGIVVIDAGISRGLTKKYWKRIEDEFNITHSNYLIYTHAHPDHYGGNSVFPDTKVIGHMNGLKEIDDRQEDPDAVLKSLAGIVEEYDAEIQSYQRLSDDWIRAFTQKIRYQYAYDDFKAGVPIKKPDITFTDSLVLSMGGINFEMKYFGRCHSGSDILVYVPESGILFSGDLIFEYGRPNIHSKVKADKEQWLEAVRWTEKRLQHIETVIGGHGQIFAQEDLSSFLRIILEK